MLDAKEIQEGRQARRYANQRLLERLLGHNEGQVTTISDRFRYLSRFDSDNDDDLSETELKDFWADFLKRTYSGRAWVLLDFDAPMVAAHSYVGAHSKDGLTEIEGDHLKFQDAALGLLHPERAMIHAHSLKDRTRVEVNIFAAMKSDSWEVVGAWLRETPFSCPNHPEVVSLRARSCPYGCRP